MARLTPTDPTTPELTAVSMKTSSGFDHLDEVQLTGDGGQVFGVTYRTPEGRRTGILPVSGLLYEVKPKRVKDTIEIEKGMGGFEMMSKNVFETTCRILTKTITRWGDQTNVTRSQLEDLFDEDFEHLTLVLATFRTAR